jgi:DNA replication initiation complex subunit (GINS family)
MLTYESIRDAVNKEKSSPGLTPLPADFFTSAKAYLDKKSKMRTKEDMWEYDQARRRMQDLVEIREKKILMGALYYVRSGVKPENLTEDEYNFLKSLADIIKEWQEKKKGMLEAKVEPATVASFTEDVPLFVGIDMKRYGPFRPGDISTLPKENAELLAKKGAARIVELNNLKA